MNVSAADILTVATLVFGEYDPRESFRSMADRIVAERPDWQRLLSMSEKLRAGEGVRDYHAQAERLRALLG